MLYGCRRRCRRNERRSRGPFRFGDRHSRAHLFFRVAVGIAPLQTKPKPRVPKSPEFAKFFELAVDPFKLIFGLDSAHQPLLFALRRQKRLWWPSVFHTASANSCRGRPARRFWTFANSGRPSRSATTFTIHSYMEMFSLSASLPTSDLSSGDIFTLNTFIFGYSPIFSLIFFS